MLWGKDTKSTWEFLKKETDESKLRVAAIGPSGEKCAYMSCPINDGHRAPGRGGGGAITGSKKIKAISVRGTQEIKVADPDRITEINKKITEVMKGNQLAEEFGV